MKHADFKERLEEILNNYDCFFVSEQAMNNGRNITTQSLITLFEDYTKAIVGEYSSYQEVQPETDVENKFRQTINQTSKTILRGESDE